MTETVLRRILRVFTRPVRQASGRGKVVIQPYRGYGSRREIYVVGRVLHQPERADADGPLKRDLGDLWRRFVRRGIGDAELAVRFAGKTASVATDRDGFFEVHLSSFGDLSDAGPWHRLHLFLDRSDDVPEPAEAEIDVYIPPETARYVVISDIDDTVMLTGVGNKLKMFWRLFMAEADARVAFPGAAAFYRALHDGASGNEANPLVYVSRGPWSIYEMLEAFFNMNDIPVGPILFLRDWGLTLQHPLPRRARDHKHDLIRRVFSVYDDYPAVLIGDSGQQDPEIYADIVREFPNRVLAVYIRNVSGDKRDRAVVDLAAKLAEEGTDLILAEDTATMARHAAENGLISPADLDALLTEKRDDEAHAPHTA